MYQPWQTDTSMEAVMKLIEERERRDFTHPLSDSHSYNPHNSESGNWGIMSVKDLSSPTRLPSKDSLAGRGRGEIQDSHRRDRSWSPERRTGRELVPVAQWGLEIASRLTKQLRVDRARFSSADDDRRASRPKWRQEIPEMRNSTNERKRRSSRSDSEGKKRGRRSNSRSKRGVSSSRHRPRYRSRSRDKARDRSSSRNRKHISSGTRKKKRSSSRGRKPYSSGFGYKKDHRSTSRDKKRDRSSSTERNTKSLSRDRDERDFSSVHKSPLQSSATIQPKQTAMPAAVADATSDILSKFISIIKDVKEQPENKKIPHNDLIPEFDPLDKANAIVTWITRVEDIAKLFLWEQSEILQFAMPKLTGVARVWYQGRKDFVHSWAEWKKKLVEQFPCPDYWQMLDELKQRQCSNNETLEKYFHDKITLVKRCGIRGRQAVQCVLHGIGDEAVRLFASAAQLDEPAELLNLLQSAEAIRNKVSTVATPALATTTPASTAGSKNDGKPQCSVCHKFGHLEANCFIAKRAVMKTVQCNTCNKYGHKSSVCWHKVKNNKIPATQSSKKLKGPKIIPQKWQCFNNCGLAGHKEPDCEIALQKLSRKEAKRKCFRCNELGHKANDCPRREENQEPRPDTTAPNGPNVGDVRSNEPPPPGVEEH